MREKRSKIAIVIKANDEFEGIRAEYDYLSSNYGRRGRDWQLKKQELIEEGNRQFDAMTIVLLADSSEVTVLFDISSFFGK